MKTKIMKIFVPGMVIVHAIVLYFIFLRPVKASTSENVSEFGKYQGYTTNLYDGYRRTSDFLTLSDGTRLAYDLYLPTKKGVPASQPLPVLFKYTPYGRSWASFDNSGNLTLPNWWRCPGTEPR